MKKMVDDEDINREANSHAFADEPVKRILTGKTDTKNNDVLVPVAIEDLYLLNTASNTLLSDETGVEKNPWNHDSGQAKIWTILDDPREVKKGREKELNSLNELRVVTAVKRSSAAR